MSDKNENSDYLVNEQRFKQISSKFSYISNASFYSTQIKIAAKEWIKYLNATSEKAKSVEVKNTGHQNPEKSTFAIKGENGFILNEKYIQKCIQNAHKKAQYQLFAFCKVNIVLDKLEAALKARK